MQEIKGQTYTLRDLLSGKKYGIDYYQREYKWQYKQVSELLTDLTDAFLEHYQSTHGPKELAAYGHYFLGPIVISQREQERFIVDGQQRITSLTLLLIYLHRLQVQRTDAVGVVDLIFSVSYTVPTFNLNVPERTACMDALLKGEPYDATGQSESVIHLKERYSDIENLFPPEIAQGQGHVLPYFVSWLIEKVHVVGITAYADADAYTIFETMNDRGLSLTSTDMLKGYLLASIDDANQRAVADKHFKQCLLDFSKQDQLKASKETDSDFFKSWLRAQYAQGIRETKKGANPEDFDLIGTEYHRWVRTKQTSIGLTTSESFSQWINQDLRFFARTYLELLKASDTLTQCLESVRYNADHGFTQQYQVLLAPLKASDDKSTTDAKLKLTADYLDCWINRRLWNSRSMGYSTVKNAVFLLSKDIRGLDLEALRSHLLARLKNDAKEMSFDLQPKLINWNAKNLHRILARLTDWVERSSSMPGRYTDYVTKSNNSYETEHLWADHYERHTHEFTEGSAFSEHRNYLGGLVLLPKKINASLNDKTFTDKVKHYQKENILAQSLHAACYEHHPGFKQMIKRTGLPFKAYDNFSKADFDGRFAVYRGIAQSIWGESRLQKQSEA